MKALYIILCVFLSVTGFVPLHAGLPAGLGVAPEVQDRIPSPEDLVAMHSQMEKEIKKEQDSQYTEVAEKIEEESRQVPSKLFKKMMEIGAFPELRASLELARMRDDLEKFKSLSDLEKREFAIKSIIRQFKVQNMQQEAQAAMDEEEQQESKKNKNLSVRYRVVSCEEARAAIEKLRQKLQDIFDKKNQWAVLGFYRNTASLLSLEESNVDEISADVRKKYDQHINDLMNFLKNPQGEVPSALGVLYPANDHGRAKALATYKESLKEEQENLWVVYQEIYQEGKAINFEKFGLMNEKFKKDLSDMDQSLQKSQAEKANGQIPLVIVDVRGLKKFSGTAIREYTKRLRALDEQRCEAQQKK